MPARIAAFPPLLWSRMLRQVLTATLQIAFLRAGPQDFPYLPRHTVHFVGASILIQALVFAIILPLPMALSMAAALVFGLSSTTRLLLRIKQHEERYVQTFQSLIAVGTLLAVLLALPLVQVAPAFEQLLSLARQPDALRGEPPVIAAPPVAGFMIDVITLWNFAINVHIYRHAADVRWWNAALLALLIAFVVWIVVVIGGSFGAILLQALPQGSP